MAGGKSSTPKCSSDPSSIFLNQTLDKAGGQTHVLHLLPPSTPLKHQRRDLARMQTHKGEEETEEGMAASIFWKPESRWRGAE